jgi:hypothetical protein
MAKLSSREGDSAARAASMRKQAVCGFHPAAVRAPLALPERAAMTRFSHARIAASERRCDFT